MNSTFSFASMILLQTDFHVALLTWQIRDLNVSLWPKFKRQVDNDMKKCTSKWVWAAEVQRCSEMLFLHSIFCVSAGPVYPALTCNQTSKSSTAVRKPKVLSAAEWEQKIIRRRAKFLSYPFAPVSLIHNRDDCTPE